MNLSVFVTLALRNLAKYRYFLWFVKVNIIMSLLPIGSINSFLVSTSPTMPSISPSKKILMLKSISQNRESMVKLPNVSKLSLNTQPQESIVKNQYRLQLNNEHSLLRSFVHIDKVDASLRDDSSYNRSFQRVSAAMNYINNNTPNEEILKVRIKETIKPITFRKIRNKCRSVDFAYEKVHEDEIYRWVSKKGGNEFLNLPSNFLKFLSEFFDALDEDQSENLTPDEFILPILAYGITTKPDYIEKALLELLGTKNLKAVRIEKDKFISLFKEDSRTDTILNSLQLNTTEMLRQIEETKIAKKLYRGYAIRTETKIEDVVPRVFCTIEEFAQMIEKWWNELCEKGKIVDQDEEKIHKNLLTEFLTKKRLVKNNVEAVRVASKLQQASMINFESFEKIFLKPMLKSALVNLAKGLNNTSFAGSDSLIMRLARCQRKFMIAGLSQRNNELSIQGRKALQAVAKYQEKNTDTSRAKVMEEVRKDILKSEQAAEDRLREYLYKIKETAHDFLDDWGNVSTTLKNPWEIRDEIKRKRQKSLV